MKTLTKNLTPSDIICFTIVVTFSYLLMAFFKIPIMGAFPEVFKYELFKSFENAIIPCGILFLLFFYYVCRLVIHLLIIGISKLLKRHSQNETIIDEILEEEQHIKASKEKQLAEERKLDATISWAIATIQKHSKLSENQIATLRSNIIALIYNEDEESLKKELAPIETKTISTLHQTN